MSQTSQPLRLGAGMSAQAAALQARLSTLGVVAKAVGAVLRLSPASKVPPDLLAEVRANKVAMMALLTVPVAAAMASPSAAILGLFPADHARDPVRDASASAPSDGVGVPDGFADEGGAGIPRRYPGAVEGLLRASQCRSVSWG